MKALLDKALGKFASRKLIAFGVSTAALFGGHLEGSEWANIAIAYVSSQAVVDTAIAMIKARK